MEDSKVRAWLRRNVKWQRFTPYYQSTLMHVATTEYGRFYRRGEQAYLVTDGGEVGKIPPYVAVEITGGHILTAQWGPYLFYNGFERTREAEYLKEMFKYPQLTDRAQKKVTDIFFNYSIWVETNQEFVSILNEREARLKNE